MGFVIFTTAYQPFIMGGDVHQPIGTVIGSYERKDIGKGYTGMLVRNSERGLWHVALRGCGAIIGTSPEKEEVLRQVREDVEAGEREVMEDQMEKGRKVREECRILNDQREFFRKFRAPVPPSHQTKLF